ncbi:MAG: M28 family peptidase [Anaerolineales bacterium]|nr:M28 family peptidase [Anaerolineales bacterium]
MTSSKHFRIRILILIFFITWTAAGCGLNTGKFLNVEGKFDGERALGDVQAQVELGPRIPNTEGHARVRQLISEELILAGWDVQIQSASRLGHPLFNIIGTADGKQGGILLGAHYDTRIYADQDPLVENRMKPVPGANDGASGVAVLLELARVLPEDLRGSVTFVFFDGEDNGGIEDWDWILGSQAYAEAVDPEPEVAVIVDMIGDRDLQIYQEKTSTAWLTDEIWKSAAELGYDHVFIPRPKYSIVDDHTPFLKARIPAVDIIDFDYPYWHTTDDTVDKVSADSLQIVGDTLLHWLVNR